MNIIEVKTLAIPDVKVIRFERFLDHRGFFSEKFRKNDLKTNPKVGFIKDFDFVQSNESYSKKGTLRGLHFQWNPFVGKLVRTVYGHLIDLALDIRKGSPTFGKIIAYDMPASSFNGFSEWVWLQPGFAHGTFFTEDSLIEYLCSGEYNPACEAGISPLAKDIDWSLCDAGLKTLLDSIAPSTKLITEKDKNGFSLTAWKNDERSNNF